MRKWLCLLLIGVLLLSVGACTRKPQDPIKDTSTPATEKGCLEIYKKFLSNIADNKELYYFVRDIDGNGVDDLIVHENTTITVYTLEDAVVKVGENDFATGTVRFLYSDNPHCPGIFYLTVGGGANHYGYLTTDGTKLLVEKLWDDHYGGLNDADRVEEFSSNTQLISESKLAYEENRDIPFEKFS